MAIVIPDLFGAFQKGREYAIDRNWKDLQNYEAIEKARNENDLGALNLLERRVMFAPKMGMYMDNADMSARNNALGGAAFPGLMAKTQAQSALDTAKANVDMGLIPNAMKTYRTVSDTSFETAQTESAIQKATNAENIKNAKTIGEAIAQARLYGEKYGAENARQAFDNAVKMNTLFQENFKVALREAKFRNSQKGLEIEQMMQQGRWEEAKNALLELGIRVEDTAYQAKKSPEQRAAENNPTSTTNATISPIASQYYQSLMTGIDFETGQPLTGIKADLYIRELNSPQYKQGAINSLTQGNFDESMTRGGRILANYYSNGTPTTNNQIVPANTKTRESPQQPLVKKDTTISTDNTDPNFYSLFGRQIPISAIGNYTLGQDQLGQVLLNRPVGTTANGIPYYIGGKTAVSPTQWLFGDANTQPFQLTADNWASMQQEQGVPILLALPKDRYQKAFINPDLAQRANIDSGQLLTIDKLYALQQALGQ